MENKPASVLVVSLGKTLNGKTGVPDTSEMATPKRVHTSRPKNGDTIRVS